MINPSDFYFAYVKNKNSCCPHGSFVLVSKEYWNEHKYLNGSSIRELIIFMKDCGFSESAENAFWYEAAGIDKGLKERKKEGENKLKTLGFVESDEVRKFANV